MKSYLKKIITEKGVSLESPICGLDGNMVIVTWTDLIDFIAGMNEYHAVIRQTLVKIDFKNGDIFHYLKDLANGMICASEQD